MPEFDVVDWGADGSLREQPLRARRRQVAEGWVVEAGGIDHAAAGELVEDIAKACDTGFGIRLREARTMKVSVELSDTQMAEILDLTGEHKKGPAIRRLMEEALQQRRPAQIAQRFLSGEWGVELETYEADQQRERQRDQEFAR
jgi:hypothetical protein